MTTNVNLINLFLGKIQLFLNKRKVNVETEIQKIADYILTTKDNALPSYLKNTVDFISYMDDVCFSDKTLYGLFEIISMHSKVFQRILLIHSIHRQLFRVFGLILGCIWKTRGIKTYVIHHLKHNDNCMTEIVKDLRAFKRFARFLHPIECSRNIMQREVVEMEMEGKSFYELDCLLTLMERAKSDPYLLLTIIKLRMLQFTIFWQMFAVAKYQSHSDIIANDLRNLIWFRMKENRIFFENLSDDILSSAFSSNESSIVMNYLSCIDLNSCSSE